jgi:hypothetical protein
MKNTITEINDSLYTEEVTNPELDYEMTLKELMGLEIERLYASRI